MKPIIRNAPFKTKYVTLKRFTYVLIVSFDIFVFKVNYPTYKYYPVFKSTITSLDNRKVEVHIKFFHESRITIDK